MRPFKLRSGPLGEQIVKTQNANSAIDAGTANANTWWAGTAETKVLNDYVYLHQPIVLTQRDLYSWPVQLEVDVWGFAEAFSATTAGQITATLIATGDLTRELPTYRTSGGVNTWPTATAARQANLVPGTDSLSLHQSANITPVTTQRLLWHYHATVCFLSGKVIDEAAGTMSWKQMTKSELFVNNNGGVYNNTTFANNTYVPASGDRGNTSHSNCLAVSRIDCTNGIKIGVGASISGFAANTRLIISGGMARLLPETDGTFSPLR
jgi:hypothetical protein